jgi:hypothetical protein
MTDENVVERVCLLAVMKKEPTETLKDVQHMLVDTGMFDMKECKSLFKRLKEEEYLSQSGSLTMKGLLQAQKAQEMFQQ